MTFYDIMKEMNWEALDCSTSEFIDIDEDNPESWTELQQYRDKISKRNKNLNLMQIIKNLLNKLPHSDECRLNNCITIILADEMLFPPQR